MNAVWTGPLLRDVLERVGVNVNVKGGGDGREYYEGLHVQFECHATKVQDDDWYGGSIPLGVAMDPRREVLLALKVSLSLIHSKAVHFPFHSIPITYQRKST